MDAKSLLMNRFKMQCIKFSWTISKNLGEVKKRLVKEMIYGIQAPKDVKFSNISRALMEPIPLIKTERIDRHIELKHKAHIYVAKDGKKEFIHLNYEAVTVALPEYPDIWCTLVIVKGFGQKPMLLLTNKQVNIHDNKQLWLVSEIYLTRWKCYECFWYIKQSYNMENFRVMGYNSIRNITVLMHSIAYFLSIYLGISLKLRIMMQKIFILSQRFFRVSSFCNYAMADGIYELLRHSKQGIIGFKSRIGSALDTFQLS